MDEIGERHRPHFYLIVIPAKAGSQGKRQVVALTPGFAGATMSGGQFRTFTMRNQLSAATWAIPRRLSPRDLKGDG
jgi:hypothetical protein